MDDEDQNGSPIKDKTSSNQMKEQTKNSIEKNVEENATTKLPVTVNTTETSLISKSLNITTDSLIANCSMSPNSQNEWKITQFYLAEAESAPKHIFSYGAQQNLSKILGSLSEQRNILLNERVSDGPSCSRVATTMSTESQIQIQTQSTQLNVLNEINAITTQSEVSESENRSTTEPEQLRSTKSVFKKEPELEGELTYGTIRPLSTEIAIEPNNADPTPASSVRSLGSLVCRICHNSENPERLVSPCLCKGTLSFVHIHCLERWISTSRSTVCELCQFQYNTEQTLRYTCIQSLRMWYSRSMSRRALQEDCQMFSLLTLVAFGIIGTLLVGIQYYFIQGRHWGLSSMWTKGWLLFFLFTTLLVYFINIYMILRSQLAPWYRWWQSARDIKLILENRKPFKILPGRRMQGAQRQSARVSEQQQATSQAQAQAHPHADAQPSIMGPQRPILPLQPLPPQAPVSQAQLLPSLGAIDSAATETEIEIEKENRAAEKLQISSELTMTAAEIIEIPLEAFDSYAFGAVVTNI